MIFYVLILKEYGTLILVLCMLGGICMAKSGESKSSKVIKKDVDVVVQAFNPSTGEAETGGSD